MNWNWRKWGLAVGLACCLAGSLAPAEAQYNVAAEQGYKRARTMASNERWDDALTALTDVLKNAEYSVDPPIANSSILSFPR